MSAPRLRFLPDVLEEHFEELAFLWGQRRRALRSPIYSRRAFLQLEERIEAHMQGVLVVGEGAFPMLEERLRSEDASELFAGAFALLRAGNERGTQLVGEAFLGAEGERLQALEEALSNAPLGALEARLVENSAVKTPRPVTAASARVLAFHGRLNLNFEQFDRLLRSETVEVRRGGWRAATLEIGTRRPEAYRAGIADPDPGVRGEAMLAAAWARQDWLLDLLRELSRRPAPEVWDVLSLFSVLARPEDSSRILSIARDKTLGPKRFALMGGLGHPAAVETLLPELESSDPATAAAAGAAFTKITGEDIGSGKRATIAPSDGHEPDEFEKEFLDEVMLPSPEEARAHWTKVQAEFAKGTRWCRGRDLSRGFGPGDLDQLDMESRWEACLRGCFERTWKGRALDLVVFPQQGG